MIDTLLETQSQSSTSRLLRIGRSCISHIMCKAVEHGLLLRDKDKIYEHVSIDEKAYKVGHKYGTILYDDDGLVIDVVDGRTTQSVKELFTKRLTEEQRKGIKTICMDMWDNFIDGAKLYLRNALICHDHYHLITYLNKAVDCVRKREVKDKVELVRTKYLWLKDRMSFTDKERVKFEALTGATYQTSQAWYIKEVFRAIAFGGTYKYPEMQYWLWKMHARRKNIPEVNAVVDMFERHDRGIINAMRTGRNNGKAERRNGSIQELRTVGRGFYDFNHFRTTILFFYGGLKLC